VVNGSRLCRSIVLCIAVIVGICSTSSGQAIFTTAGRGNQILILPTPFTGAPNPQMLVVSGVPSNAVPKGATYAGRSIALVADSWNSRVFVVDTSLAKVTATIETSSVGYHGTGTVAASPDGSVVLAAGETEPFVYVIHAPFGPNSLITTVTFSGQFGPGTNQTDAIVFDATGRAFVHGTTFGSATVPDPAAAPNNKMAIDVFDPPYTSLAFTMIAPGPDLFGALAITPDGKTLLATNLVNGSVTVLKAPFSAGSVASVRAAPPGNRVFDGIGVAQSSDATAIVVDEASPFAIYFPPPYATSGGDGAQFPSSVTRFSTGFTDIASGRNGAKDAVILTGEASGSPAGQPAVFADGTTAGGALYVVTIPGGGRGQGCARFAPTGCTGRGCVDPLAVVDSTRVNRPGGR
jgi:hypothetical protein